MVIQHVEVRIAGAVADPCRIALPMSITHGRSDVTTQPDPPSASILWDGAECTWKIGDSVEIWAGVQYEPAFYDSPDVLYDDSRSTYDSDATGEVMGCRFKGVIAGLTAHGNLGVVTGWDIEAIGGMARLGTVQVKMSRGVETGINRAKAIATAAGTTVRVLGTHAVSLAATTIDTDALSALHDVCESTGGLLWQDKQGRLTYGTAKHRPGEGSPLGVIPCEALDSVLSWDEDMESIVNEVTAKWGPDPQAEVTHSDSASIASPWGLRHVDITTQCAAEADADQLALLVIARRAWPYYGVTNGLVAVSELDADASRLFGVLDVSAPVLIPIPNVPGPTPSDPTPVVVEGWIEEWNEAGEHTAQAAFSDQRRWIQTTIRDYADVLARGDYAYWKARDYLTMLVKQAGE